MSAVTGATDAAISGAASLSGAAVAVPLAITAAVSSAGTVTATVPRTVSSTVTGTIATGSIAVTSARLFPELPPWAPPAPQVWPWATTDPLPDTSRVATR